MPVSSLQRRFIGQPVNNKRLEFDPRHWLSRRVLFAHTGRQGLLRGEPVEPVSEPLRPVLGASTPPTDGLPIGLAINLSSESDLYSVYPTGGHKSTDLTLSAWVIRSGTAITNRCYLSSCGFDTNAMLLRNAGTTNRTVASHANNSTAFPINAQAAGWDDTNVWRHAVASFFSDSSRAAYYNGGNKISSTASGDSSNAHSLVVVGAFFRGSTGTTPQQIVAGISGLALPMVIEGALADEEVTRLYEEQRSRPWALFRERPMQIWLGAAASGLPTLSASTFVPGSVTSTGWITRHTAT